jgi:ATP-dependent protease ClpP protease subunit
MTISNEDDPHYLPTLSRGVFVDADVENELLVRLTPRILQLREESADPITLYINSAGGGTRILDHLRDILDTPNIRLITVVTGMAASAAADLLICGQYAIAYPHAFILCYGTRLSSDELTKEGALEAAEFLDQWNEKAALATARASIDRFLFRFACFKKDIPLICRKSITDGDIQHPAQDIAKPGSPCTRCESDVADSMSLRCFVELLQNYVPSCSTLLYSALAICEIYDQLDTFIIDTIFKEQPEDEVELLVTETRLFKIILDFDPDPVSDNEGIIRKHLNWPSEDITGRAKFAGMMLAAFRERNVEEFKDFIFDLSSRWRLFLLSPEEKGQWSKFSDDEKGSFLAGPLSDRVRKFWLFMLLIARLLQTQDFQLTAEDAYWLGLIDEVYGKTSELPSSRILLDLDPFTEEDPESQNQVTGHV